MKATLPPRLKQHSDLKPCLYQQTAADQPTRRAQRLRGRARRDREGKAAAPSSFVNKLEPCKSTSVIRVFSALCPCLPSVQHNGPMEPGTGWGWVAHPVSVVIVNIERAAACAQADIYSCFKSIPNCVHVLVLPTNYYFLLIFIVNTPCSTHCSTQLDATPNRRTFFIWH